MHVCGVIRSKCKRTQGYWKTLPQEFLQVFVFIPFAFVLLRFAGTTSDGGPKHRWSSLPQHRWWQNIGSRLFALMSKKFGIEILIFILLRYIDWNHQEGGG